MKKEISLTTSDGIRVNATLTKADSAGAESACMIVVPGFAQHSQTDIMVEICKSLSSFADVLCLDCRGTGKSEGSFSFGASEYLDIKPALDWSKPHYRKTYLMGLSLGAYSALRAVTTFENPIQHLFLVSCPTSIEEIVWSGSAIKHAYLQAFKPSAWLKSRGLIFKWAYPFQKKPSAEDFASELKVPVSFLIGSKDVLTPKGMSERIYHKIRAEKSWLEIPDGMHAEELLSPLSKEVEAWLIAGLKTT